ncbi:hypothetical protein MJO28_014777 [Puccinia striiformis f. sp. tritici]|uniref:Uncharacterized protein n=1 Tax=Puccinia striiformis f. sp. tritici TaxID=168172 RepID=A0ACC0DUL2_9BASI|nr:hypothetical protein MJO28_014777 [Puccinia striiformis f. sp. tritici]KAI7939827.1 hypothetical protein MJO29_014563 [Puccinia striiformis f. sp. tritici]
MLYPTEANMGPEERDDRLRALSRVKKLFSKSPGSHGTLVFVASLGEAMLRLAWALLFNLIQHARRSA